MFPHLTEALAEERIADLRREAAARGSAARATNGASTVQALARRAGRLTRSLGRRRHREIELVWPDGVRSLVATGSDEPTRPLANTRP